MQEPTQVYCQHCKGGNLPVARMCQWCGRPLDVQQAANQAPPTRNTPLIVIGTILLTLGIPALLCSGFTFYAVLTSPSTNATNGALTLSIVFVGLALLLLIVPGFITLVFGIQSKTSKN